MINKNITIAALVAATTVATLLAAAGIVHVEPNGVTRVRFKPDQNTSQIKAFAISLEREGGVPKREGPIVMIGNA